MHKDYDRISEVMDMINAGDPNQPDDPHFVAIIDNVADEEAMTSFARQHIRHVIAALPRISTREHLLALLMAIWVEGFTAGVMFQKSGGHRDG